VIYRQLFFWAVALSSVCFAAETNSTLLELSTRSFFLGRDYFLLRSGRAQMIVQADQADLGPAVTYLLFDAANARQSVRKENAFNFVPGAGFGASALEVTLGGFNFTALGHRTTTRWIVDDGVPAIEAVWWAGGVRVTERLSAMIRDGVFIRKILLEGANLAGEESLRVHLQLPTGECQNEGSALIVNSRGARLGLVLLNAQAVKCDPAGGMEIGPVLIRAGTSQLLETCLVAQIPSGDRASFSAQLEHLRSDGAKSLRTATQAHWQIVSSIATPDSTVQEIFDKTRFGLDGMIAEDGTMDAGIFEYGAQWVRDSSNTALGALHAGHFELARAALERILKQMISPAGATMIAGSFDTPDREQFDQMGELLELLKAYYDWTGDDSLIRENRERILALIERPLSPVFRDGTGMVHNRREFWERTFEDGYELAYQTYVVLGLLDAAELSTLLGTPERAERWRAEARKIRAAMFSDAGFVAQGRLIKRRNIDGTIAEKPPASFKGYQPDAPMTTEREHLLQPDATQALPIALGLVPATSDLANRTLDDLERLWNARWSDGGYDRYHTSVQPDQPGPWPFATCFILRAQHEAGFFGRSRRSLEWLNSMAGGRAGLWFEEIPSIRSLNHSCGLVCWTSAELAQFVVRHYLGVRFENHQMVVRPALYPGAGRVEANLRYRNGRLKMEVDGAGSIVSARVNGVEVHPDAGGSIRLPPEFSGGDVIIHAKH